MNKIYSVTAFSFFPTAFILLPVLSFCVAGGGPGGSSEAGKSVNPAEVRQIPGETPVTPRFGPTPYTDDVIKMKKIQNSEVPPPKADTDGNGAELDKSE